MFHNIWENPSQLTNSYFSRWVGQPPTSITGWWFGTFFIFPYIGVETNWLTNHPNWLIFFRGVETTNQHYYYRWYCPVMFPWTAPFLVGFPGHSTMGSPRSPIGPMGPLRLRGFWPTKRWKVPRRWKVVGDLRWLGWLGWHWMTGRAAHLAIFSGAKKCLQQWNEHIVKYVAKPQNIGFFGKLM